MARGDDDETSDLLRTLRDLVASDDDTLTRGEVRALREVPARVAAIEASLSALRAGAADRKEALYGTREAPGLFERLRVAEATVGQLREDIGPSPALRDEARAHSTTLARWAGGIVVGLIILGIVMSILDLAAKAGLFGASDLEADSALAGDGDAPAAGDSYVYGGSH